MMEMNLRLFQIYFLCPAVSCPKETNKMSNSQLSFTLMYKISEVFQRRDAIICLLVLFHFTTQILSLMLDEKFSNGKCQFQII